MVGAAFKEGPWRQFNFWVAELHAGGRLLKVKVCTGGTPSTTPLRLGMQDGRQCIKNTFIDECSPTCGRPARRSLSLPPHSGTIDCLFICEEEETVTPSSGQAAPALCEDPSGCFPMDTSLPFAGSSAREEETSSSTSASGAVNASSAAYALGATSTTSTIGTVSAICAISSARTASTASDAVSASVAACSASAASTTGAAGANGADDTMPGAWVRSAADVGVVGSLNDAAHGVLGLGFGYKASYSEFAAWEKARLFECGTKEDNMEPSTSETLSIGVAASSVDAGRNAGSDTCDGHPQHIMENSTRRNRSASHVTDGRARHIGYCAASGPRWWTEMKEVCPLSAFPVKLLPYPPFKFQGTDGIRYVDGTYLVLQVLVTWRFEALGRALTMEDVSALDNYMKRCKQGRYRLARALELLATGNVEDRREFEEMRALARKRFEGLWHIKRQRATLQDRRALDGQGTQRPPQRATALPPGQLPRGVLPSGGLTPALLQMPANARQLRVADTDVKPRHK